MRARALRHALGAVLAPAVWLAAWLAPAAARANEADTYGLGSRSAALGGAVAADATDFSANYYNPAGLVGARGPSLSIGYTYAHNHLTTNGQDNGVADVHGIVGGLALPGTFFGVPFAFGVGLYMPDSGLSQVVALRQEVPRWALYGESSSIVFIAANLAVRPVPWLELGGGVAFLAATKGSFQITGTLDIQNLYNSQLRHEVDADLSAVRYPQVGARVQVPGFGYLAAVYRGETKLDLQLTAHLQGQVKTPLGINVPLTYDLTTQTADAFLPQQFVLGASFQRVRRLTVDLDFTYVNWSSYESPTAITTANLAVQLPPGLMNAITLPPNPKPVTIIPPGFHDQLVPHLGVEYVFPVAGGLRRLDGDPIERRALEIPVRAGYVYERTPVPPQTGTTSYIDTDRHTVSLGTGLTLNAPGSVLKGSLALDVHGALSVLPERVTLKQNPADFVGDFRASGTMLALGATLTAVF
jgi:long-chain fatty acid transport protein